MAVTYDAPAVAYDDAAVTYDGATTPTPPAPVVEDAGSPWGPWRRIRVRPLHRGRIEIRFPTPVVALSGTVGESDEWLLGLPTDSLV